MGSFCSVIVLFRQLNYIFFEIFEKVKENVL